MTDDHYNHLRELLEWVLRDLPRGPKLAYTLKEAIAATGIGKTSLYDDQAAGRLEMRKRGSSTIILTEELQRYLAALPAFGALP